MSTETDYAAACARATTAQGLDPIVARLRAERIACEVDQTGGLTMCVRVDRADGWYVYVTAGDVDDGDAWIVCAYGPDYDTNVGQCGVDLADGLVCPPDLGVALVSQFRMGAIPIGCAYCACAGCKSCGGLGYVVEQADLVVGQTYDVDALVRLADATGAIVIGLDDEPEVEPEVVERYSVDVDCHDHALDVERLAAFYHVGLVALPNHDLASWAWWYRVSGTRDELRAFLTDEFCGDDDDVLDALLADAVVVR